MRKRYQFWRLESLVTFRLPKRTTSYHPHPRFVSSLEYMPSPKKGVDQTNFRSILRQDSGKVVSTKDVQRNRLFCT